MFTKIVGKENLAILANTAALLTKEERLHYAKCWGCLLYM